MSRLGARCVPIKKVFPNKWNPNEMPPHLFKKLKNNLKKLIKESPGKIPPIVVRPRKNGYEIIDGEHRWRALQELKQKKINLYSIEVNDDMAHTMTNTLNYLRGTPNREKYAQSIVDLLELGTTTEALADLLPESMDEIDQLLEETDVSVEAFKTLVSEEEKLKEDEDNKGKNDLWIDLKFRVSVAQAEVVEREIKRIEGILSGKQKRGRAIEYMAVQSSQTELPE
jgi:ParB/RepB/Spo0J family partition protein